MLYLHEIIDIIGDGQQAYLDTVGERAAHSEREGISRLMGTWRVIGRQSLAARRQSVGDGRLGPLGRDARAAVSP